MSGRLARSAGLIGVATLSSRLLGLVRDAVLAAFFGTGMAADAWGAATRFTTLLRDLFAEGAMSTAFVPTLSRYLQRDGRPAAWRLGSQVINALLVASGFVVLIGMVFTEPLVSRFAEGYQDDPDKLALTIRLARLTMPFLTLVAVAAAFMGMLNALKRFFIPASSPALYNVAFIACTLVLVPTFRSIGVEPALALGYAMLIGGIAQVATQWPLLRKEGFRHQWILNPQDPGLREVLFLMGPGSLGVAAAQVNLLVNTWLATREAGAVAALGLAFRLMYMPIGIIGVSVATAAIPDLARHAGAGAKDAMRATLGSSLRLMLTLSVPATIGLMVLSTPIVALIYQRGQFDATSTRLVADALIFYAPGIVGYSVVKLASPGFYSLQDARTPMMVSLFTIAVNLGLNLWLNSVMGFRGLALGTAIAANVNAGLLLWLLGRRIGGMEANRVGLALGKITIASFVMGVAVYYGAAWLADHLSGTGLMHRLGVVFGAMALGIVVLAATAWVVRLHELRIAVAQIAARVRRR